MSSAKAELYRDRVHPLSPERGWKELGCPSAGRIQTHTISMKIVISLKVAKRISPYFSDKNVTHQRIEHFLAERMFVFLL